MIIEKRDGTLEQFNLSKIRNAISNVLEEKDIDTVLTKIEKNLPKKDKVTVEEIQDIVEKTLMSLKFFEQGKSYILYRKQRENIRNSKTSLTKTFKEVLDADGSDISRENANVDGKAPMGLMLLFGSEIEKDYVKRYMISPKFTELHDNGDIHIHDLNMYACTFNCCNIGLKELFRKGFNTGHGTLRPPQSISTALTQAAIVVQANQNDMYGGQGIPLYDYELSPYIAKTLGSNIKDTIESVLGQEIDFNFKDFCYSLCEKNNSSLVDESLKELESKIYEFVGDKTKKVLELSRKRTFKDTFQACESFVHNLNTLNSRCGSQVPFSSINYGTNTTPEGQMLIENTLEATEEGLGNGETPIFPVQIFKIKEGVNANPGDPNYYLLEKAVEVTSKRMYPNFVNIDVPGNIEYYQEGKPETEMATMGALAGEEHLYVKIDGGSPVDISIKNLFEYCKTGILTESRPCKLFFNKKSVLLKGDKTIQEKSGITPGAGVYSVTYIPEDISYIGSSSDVNRRLAEHRSRIRLTGGLDAGVCFGDTNVENYSFKVLEYTENYVEREKFYIQNVENINLKGISQKYFKQYGSTKRLYEKPTFKQDTSVSQELIDTQGRDIMVLDRDLKWVKMNHIFKNDKRNTPRMMRIFYKEFDKEYCLRCTEDHPLYVGNNKFVRADSLKKGDKIFRVDGLELEVTDISWCWQSVDSYDIGTATGSFVGSDIIMHNCRTKTLAMPDGTGRVTNRGNIAFTTINLPRLGILAEHKIDKFFELLDQRITDCIDELLERVNYIKTKKVYNFPFLMGQNIYLGAENLGWNDSIEPALRNGTLAVGFIGIAEALKALIGKHHGESKEAYQLALKIVKRIRERTDKATSETGWMFGCFATPAEGLAERFAKIDQKKFGIIEGVTDRKFYTNSFHIPVYFPITATKKMQKEGPFHSLCNAGAITYVEMDGDPSKNLKAVMKLVQFSRKCGISYFSINHSVDRCPVCGYEGIIETDVCPHCGWKEGEEISLEELEKKGIDTKKLR